VPVGAERLDLNAINIVLSELNKLKVARDRALAAGAITSFADVFRSTTTPEGAPPGARIAVRGQPSIDDIRTVVFGIRNREGGRVAPIDTVEVWVNELRVSGYDEAGGASGFLNANLTLADIGNVQARLSFTEDGFGDLGGGLGGRDFVDQAAFSLASSFNAHKLLPERFGLNVPVNLTVSQNEATPRFDPNRGDIRLDELVDAALSDTLGTDADRRLTADRIVERAETVSAARNFRISATKSGSRSPWLRYTLDGLSAAYSTSAQTARSPANARNDASSWTANLAYRLSTPRPKTVRPLWFAADVPVLGTLSGLRLNVLPQSVLLSTVARRSVSNTRPRLQAIFENEPEEVQAFRVRTRRTQLFDHDRQFDVQYNPFTFLTLAYGSNTRQDLGAAGQVESFSILVRREATDSTAAFSQVYAISPEEAQADGSIVREDLGLPDGTPFSQFGVDVLGGATLDVVPFGNVLSGLLDGSRDVRTRGYTQTLTSSLRVSTRRVKWLSWIRPQALSYGASYQWDDVPIAAAPDLRVASAGTRIQLQGGIQTIPRDFWRLFPFYRNMEAAAGRTGTGRTRAATDSTRTGFRPTTLLRTAFLAATGITDLTLTYRGSFASSTGGLEGDAYSLLAALRGDAPSLGYRLGLTRSLPLDDRLGDVRTNFQYNDLLSDQHTLEARTQLEPFRALRVGLVWQTNWNRADRQPFGYRAANADSTEIVPVRLPADQRGGGTSSVYAFGGSYEGFLQRHIARFEADIDGTPEAPDTYVSEFLLRSGIASDFRREFARGLGAFGPRGLFPVPVPGWDVTYSGLGTLPLIRSATNQVSLRHNYSASSQADYTSFFATGDRSPRSVEYTPDLLDVLLLAPAADRGAAAQEPTTLTVTERFQPMVGLNVSWKAGFQTDITWNRSNLYSLQATSASMTEKTIEDFQLQFSFAKTGLRVPGFRRLNNNVRITLNASLSTDETQNRSIGPDLTALLRGAERTALDPLLTRRLSLWPRISYTVSNQVTADFFLRYERSNPAPPAFPTRNVDGGVSLRILFSN
jgi:cell surface protein SprA